MSELQNNDVYEHIEISHTDELVKKLIDLVGGEETSLQSKWVFRGIGESDTYTLVPTALRSDKCDDLIDLVNTTAETGPVPYLDTRFFIDKYERAILAQFYRQADQAGLSLPPVSTELHHYFKTTSISSTYTGTEEIRPEELYDNT